MEHLEKADSILKDLMELADNQMKVAKAKNYFSKDLAEAIGIIVSLAYGRWGNNDK